ncbi:MAG: hypothetical protein R3F34_14555 [Planctomycetota bacterium]
MDRSHAHAAAVGTRDGRGHVLLARVLPALLVLLLAAIVLAASPRGRGGPVATPRVYAWICDRKADQLVAVDAELVPTAVVPVPCPLRVEARSDGSVFAILSHACGPTGRHDLALARADGSVGRLVAFDPVRDVDAMGDDALVLEGSWAASATRLWRVDENGAALQLAAVDGASTCASNGSDVVVGTIDGSVLLLGRGGPTSPVRARVELGDEIADVVAAGRAGWWVLTIATAGRVVRLDAELTPLFEVALGGISQDLAVAADGERVLVATEDEPRLVVVAGDGTVVLDAPLDPSLGAIDRGDGDGRGGALLAAAGHVVRFDGSGSARLVQGGLDGVSDVSVVP